jgi:hypothetical protein
MGFFERPAVTDVACIEPPQRRCAGAAPGDNGLRLSCRIFTETFPFLVSDQFAHLIIRASGSGPRRRRELTLRRKEFKRRKNSPCIYCGTGPAGSVDHVPPEGFFPRPRPKNLITVPCCRPCNEGFSMDDQYARTVIALRQDVAIQPRLIQLRQSTVASLERPENQRFRTMLAENLKHVPVRLASGIVTPPQPILFHSRRRLVGWFKRLFRGLHYHEAGASAPDDFEIEVTFGDEHPEFVAQYVQWCRSRDHRVLGDGVFEYQWMPVPDRPEASIWWIEFYHCMAVAGFIHPRLTPEEGRLTRSPCREQDR